MIEPEKEKGFWRNERKEQHVGDLDDRFACDCHIRNRLLHRGIASVVDKCLHGDMMEMIQRETCTLSSFASYSTLSLWARFESCLKIVLVSMAISEIARHSRKDITSLCKIHLFIRHAKL